MVKTAIRIQFNEFHAYSVTCQPNKNKFEPTSDPSVSIITCVESCPTLLVEGEAHQHINSTELTFLREAKTIA